MYIVVKLHYNRMIMLIRIKHRLLETRKRTVYSQEYMQ